MNKTAINDRLFENHNGFMAYLNGLTSDDFMAGKQDKWTAGQQLEHIILSIKPVRQALSLPKFLLPILFGKANRKSKSFDELQAKYVQKLENGGRATARFIPKAVAFEKRAKLIEKLQKEVSRLSNKMNRFSEEELDAYILPHPLLGRLTLREMLFFTIYHVEHHQMLVIRDLKQ